LDKLSNLLGGCNVCFDEAIFATSFYELVDFYDGGIIGLKEFFYILVSFDDRPVFVKDFFGGEFGDFGVRHNIDIIFFWRIHRIGSKYFCLIW